MNLYLVETLKSVGYDEYDSFVVTAENEKQAALFHPRMKDENGLALNFNSKPSEADYFTWFDEWNATPTDVKVTCIGKATEEAKAGEVIIISFNASW